MTDTSLLQPSHSKDYSSEVSDQQDMEIKKGHMTAPSVDVAGECLPRVSVLVRSGLRALDFSMSVDVVSSSHLRRVVGRTPCSLFHIRAAFSPHSLFPAL